MRSLLMQSPPFRSPALQGGGLRLLAASATQAIVDRMSSPPSASRVDAIFALVLALMDAGVWSRLDLLHVLAAHHEQAARLNLIAPAFDLAAYNSPIFTANRGFKGDGSAAWMAASGYDPGAGGTQYTLNNASMGAWVLTPATNAGLDIFNGSGRLGRRDTTGDDYHYRLNDGTSYYGPGGSIASFHVVDRPDNATKRRFRDGVFRGSGAVAATTIGGSLRLFSTGNGSWSNAELAVTFAGASMTEAQHAAFYAALRAYLLSVGAITP